MSEKPELLDEETAKSRLRDYIFHKRASTERVFVPHRIPREVASQFIRDEVDVELRPENMDNAGNAARFYFLKDCVDHFGSFLGAQVRDVSDALRTMACIRLLGNLGEKDQQNQAFEAFERLVQHRMLDQFAEPLIQTYFHLGLDTSEKKLADRLEQMYRDHVKTLENRKRPDTRANQLDDLVHYKLVYAAAAKKKKDLLWGGGRDEVRAYALARVYLGMVDYSRFGREWASYALVAEAERSSPANVVKGVRTAASELDAQKPDADRQTVKEHLEDARSRVCDAIAYFEGELTDKEKVLFESEDRPVNLYTPQEEIS